jgi:predicted Zn-dependent protease
MTCICAAWSEALSNEKDRTVRALGLLEQAIARDPRYAPALAAAANCHLVIDLGNWTDDPVANRRAALRLARQALQLASDDPMVLATAGRVLGYFGEDISAALRLVERALALNPSYAVGWRFGGILNLFAGRTESAIEHFETCLRLDPRGSHGTTLFCIGAARFFERRFEEALEMFLPSLEEMPALISTYQFLAACYAHLGRLREAGEIIDRPRTTTRVVMPNTVPFRKPEHRELFLSGLRLALGEEAPRARPSASPRSSPPTPAVRG